jgi:hypothetical protein
MKNTILTSLLLTTLLFVFTVEAELYKGLDNEGNIVYSDKPFDNAKKFTPPSLTIFDAPKLKANKEANKKDDKEEKIAEVKYTDFGIVSPADNQTLWNDPNPTVSLKLKPALNTAAGHTIWLLINDQPLIKNSQSLSLHIGHTDRGANQLQAQVRDKDGKIIARTRTIVIHVKRAVITKKSPR